MDLLMTIWIQVMFVFLLICLLMFLCQCFIEICKCDSCDQPITKPINQPKSRPINPPTYIDAMSPNTRSINPPTYIQAMSSNN